jgi:saccharopine dehydrogenase-like NADP-dependent oxidoreductase
LRRPGYADAWNALVQLGMTDDTYQLATDGTMTYRQFTEAYLPDGSNTVEQRLCSYLGIAVGGEEHQKLEFLGMFETDAIGLDHPTPAQVLEKRMVERWALAPGDKDLIVMQHLLEYELKGAQKQLSSSLVVTGDDPVRTGMAKTVGLPVGIAARLLLQGRFSSRGVVMPTTPEFYEPILKELEEYGVMFEEK